MWDLFISHASEDKDTLVRPLAKKLTEIYKVKVWYDEFELEYGDSLLDSIEKGLQQSNFGVVVFSKEFLKKAWTNHEFKSLRTRELLLNKKVIIPIWYNITREDIAEYSLTLVDKVAITLSSNELDIDDLSTKIIKIVRPDIYDNINRMCYFEELVKNSQKCLISVKEFSKIQVPPIRHETLSICMEARLKLIHNAIKDVDTRNYEKYEEDFRRSTNIDREIVITELLTAAYLECTSIRKMSKKERTNVYIFVFMQPLFNSKIDLTFTQGESERYIGIIKKYLQGINAEAIMEYKFI